MIGFISICAAHQSITESNFQEIISEAKQGEAEDQYAGYDHDDGQVGTCWNTVRLRHGSVLPGIGVEVQDDGHSGGQTA